MTKRVLLTTADAVYGGESMTLLLSGLKRNEDGTLAGGYVVNGNWTLRITDRVGKGRNGKGTYCALYSMLGNQVRGRGPDLKRADLIEVPVPDDDARGCNDIIFDALARMKGESK